MTDQTTGEPWEPAYGFCATKKTDPRSLALALETVRRKICDYGPDAKTCDCKYGVGAALAGDHGYALVGERTGCPELRELIHMLMRRAEALAAPAAAEAAKLLVAHGLDRAGWDAEARRLRNQLAQAIAERDEARASLADVMDGAAK